MRKEELIHLHILLAQLKRYFEKDNLVGEFSRYQSLQISPGHIHRSKAEHKEAIFVLGNELASMISDEGVPGVERTSARMQELADRISAEGS
jgi:hypothetical protein